MRYLAATVLTGLVLVGSGCSGEVSLATPSVARETVEREISSRLAAHFGREPESVSCPDDLPGTVGQVMRCTLSDSGSDLGVSVEVSAVEGAKVRFSAEVDTTPVEE